MGSARHLVVVLLAYFAALALAVLTAGPQSPLLSRGAHTLTVDLSGVPREGLVGGQVYITYPGGHLFREVGPDKLRVTFMVPMGDIQEKAGTVEGRLRERGFVEHATLSITLYYTGPNGSLCIRRVDFSTFDYYLNLKGGNPVEAYKLAAQDPLAILRLNYIKVEPGWLSGCTTLTPSAGP
ncbi:MAG: hypothetical protein LRS49_00180 [Desulfurococcales archaeon]|nr:hypothetical protein [Desulfurococcales archaeon]